MSLTAVMHQVMFSSIKQDWSAVAAVAAAAAAGFTFCLTLLFFSGITP